jgi:hypothetical protein
MTKITGSGCISQRHGSADPDLDPHQYVMDPQHWYSDPNPDPYKKMADPDLGGNGRELLKRKR